MDEDRPNYPINVKIPKLYVNIIDLNLVEGKSLSKEGFTSRAHFVREAVREKLASLHLMTGEDDMRLEEARKGW